VKTARLSTPLFFFIPVLFLVLLNGCGYSIHRQASLPFREIGIGSIENRTLEPKLQDKLHRALVEEFRKQGISVTPAAANRITGVISNFNMVGLSEKEDIVVEYSVMVNADFGVVDREGKVRELKNISSPFIVSFTGSEDLGRLLATRDMAVERAMRDIAMQIVGALIYK
jgi:hypothetical protein